MSKQSSTRPNAGPSKLVYLTLVIVLVSAFLLVGGARDDLLSLLIWRPFSMLLLVCSIAYFWRTAWQNGRALLIFALAVLALTAVHLVPLPPSVWTALPGREIVAAIYGDAGMEVPWQPLSLAQARTWNALFSLAAPLGALILFLALDQHHQVKLLTVLLVLGFLSGIVGMLQAVGPANGPLYFYRITNSGESVGLFANRNHQAAFLATLYPLIAAKLSLFSGKPEELLFRRTLALTGAMLLAPLILMTGSRGGLMLAVLGLALGWWVYRAPVSDIRAAERATDNRRRWIGIALVALLLLFAAIVAARTTALDRLLETDTASELRVSALPAIIEAIRSFLPFGSGLGTFVEVYQAFEPERAISASYFNHAHNDFVELLLTAGLPGMLLLGWAVALFAVAAFSMVRARHIGRNEQGFTAQVLGRAGLSIIAMLALSSAADYPLRVPSLMLLAVVAAGWCLGAFRSASK